MMRGISRVRGRRREHEASVLAWLRAVRAREWIHFTLLPLAAYEPSRGWVGLVALARGVTLACLVLAYGYLLNAIADRTTDRLGKNPLADGEALDAKAGVLFLAAAAACLAAFGPHVVRAATVVCLASGAVYSVGPRIKRLPVVGTLANAASFAPLLWVGAASDERMTWMPGVTFAFVCLLLQNQLLHEAADQAEDRVATVRTTVLWLGNRRAGLVAGLTGVALLVAASRSMGPLGAVLFVVPFVGVFPFLLTLHGGDARKMAWTRRAHRVCALATGALWLAWVR